MKIGIGNDHAAIAYKVSLKEYLESKGYEVIDYGSTDPNAKDDYPDFGQAVGEAVANGIVDKGVTICGTGIGIAMAANKVPGVRAAMVSEPVTAALTVRHNDANIISIGERIVGLEMAKAILDAFLGAEFEGGRHTARVDKIRAIEAKYSK